MSVVHLPRWDVTPIEIALDLEPLGLLSAAPSAFSGPSEPRICMVAGYALTSQLKRITTAVDRVLPARLPSRLRIAPAKARTPNQRFHGTVAITPMLALLRLQQRLIRAIEPGLAHRIHVQESSETDPAVAQFVSEFITSKTLPTFEPPLPELVPTRLRAVGITLYRLGRNAKPESIIGHWAYGRNERRTLPLRSGP